MLYTIPIHILFIYRYINNQTANCDVNLPIILYIITNVNPFQRFVFIVLIVLTVFFYRKILYLNIL